MDDEASVDGVQRADGDLGDLDASLSGALSAQLTKQYMYIDLMSDQNS